jgi:integrase
MKLPKGVYQRNKSSPQLWIDYPDENGKRIRESAHTTDPTIAENFRNQRLVRVAERKLIPTRKFETITVGEILDFWWDRHAKDRPSKFQYLLPRLDKFRSFKARHLTPEMVQDFLDDLLKTLSPSSVNHYRTILNSAFNFAIRWKKYDDNPVVPIKQIPEREARDRFVEVKELVSLIEKCQEEEDFELQAFIILAACTGMRKGSILSRKWDEVPVDDEFPYIHMPKKDSKNRRANRLPLPALCVFALRQLPSYQKHEYLFPAKPNVRFKENFSKPYAWDLGKRFRRICKLAKISDLRIHDLRHFATTMLFMEGVADAIIRKMTGHRSEELERYKHFSPTFKQQTTELIAGELSRQLATKTATSSANEEDHPHEWSPTPDLSGLTGGADGTRTRDLRRDRPAL